MNPAWKPGVSGNPNGRPKGSTAKMDKVRELMTDFLIQKLENIETLWDECTPKEKVTLLGNLSKYVVPSLSGISFQGNLEQTIEVVYTPLPAKQFSTTLIKDAKAKLPSNIEDIQPQQ